MKDRRTFLKKAVKLTVASPLLLASASSFPTRARASEHSKGVEKKDQYGFKPHWMKQGNDKEGWTSRPAEMQFLHCDNGKLSYQDPDFKWFCPWGVTQMDNGEVILIGDVNHGDQTVEQCAVAFSRDRGNTWSEFEVIEDAPGRPLMLTYLGKGNLAFQPCVYAAETYRMYFSSDYGRTWPERRVFPSATNGDPFWAEGNALVDRDENGVATRIAQLGYNLGGKEGLKGYPEDPRHAYLRWSTDGGRTWINESSPENWLWKEVFQGKTYLRGISEGSLVRAANGWLVAAVRTDMPFRHYKAGNDNLEGTAVSISKDNGKTWSDVQVLFEGGCMHAHLLLMPNGDIVLTHILRQHVQGGRLASYRRGCGSVISRDNGLSWDMAHRYLLDDFEFADGTSWALACGHLSSALLDNGHILTAYGNYVAKGAGLIRWKPTAG